MPINYTGQNALSVGVQYSALPAGTSAIFANADTGAKTPSGSNALQAGGDGTASVPFPVGLPPGDYYLEADCNGEWVGQTVKFHTTGGPPTEMPP
jgi:hypothetical protein